MKYCSFQWVISFFLSMARSFTVRTEFLESMFEPLSTSRNTNTMTTKDFWPGLLHHHERCQSLKLPFILLPQDQSTVTGRVRQPRNCCLAIPFVVGWGITAWPNFICTFKKSSSCLIEQH